MSENNPFPSENKKNIYAPPTKKSEKAKYCPNCGEVMELGRLHSRAQIQWIGDNDNPLKNFIFGGNSIGKSKSFSMTKISAYRCKSCKLFTLSQ